MSAGGVLLLYPFLADRIATRRPEPPCKRTADEFGDAVCAGKQIITPTGRQTVVSVKPAFLLSILCLVETLCPSIPGYAAPLLGVPADEAELNLTDRFDLVRSRDAPESAAENQIVPEGLVKYEIRYVAPEAETVYLLWGLNDWQVPDESYWPPGSAARKQFPYCKMQRQGGEFTISFNVPEGAVLDYCFNVLAPARGINVWDTNVAGHHDYHSKVVAGGTALIIGQRISPSDPASSASRPSSPLRFFLPALAALLAAPVVLRLLRRARHRAH